MFGLICLIECPDFDTGCILPTNMNCHPYFHGHGDSKLDGNFLKLLFLANHAENFEVKLKNAPKNFKLTTFLRFKMTLLDLVKLQLSMLLFSILIGESHGILLNEQLIMSFI